MRATSLGCTPMCFVTKLPSEGEDLHAVAGLRRHCGRYDDPTYVERALPSELAMVRPSELRTGWMDDEIESRAFGELVRFLGRLRRAI